MMVKSLLISAQTPSAATGFYPSNFTLILFVHMLYPVYNRYFTQFIYIPYIFSLFFIVYFAILWKETQREIEKDEMEELSNLLNNYHKSVFV